MHLRGMGVAFVACLLEVEKFADAHTMRCWPLIGENSLRMPWPSTSENRLFDPTSYFTKLWVGLVEPFAGLERDDLVLGGRFFPHDLSHQHVAWL